MPGGHFLWNEPKEAKFTSVPLRRHKVRYAPAPCTGAIRPLPCVGSSGKSHACFGCSVVNALPTPPLRYQLFPGVGYFRFIRKKERLLLLPRLVRSENRFKSPLRSVKRFLPTDTRGRHSLAPTHGRKYRYRRLANTGIPLPPSRRNRYSVARIR